MPIHYAIIKDHVEIIHHIDKYKSYNNKSLFDQAYYCNKEKLMTLAVLNGSYKCVRELEAIGANCLEKDLYGHTYLHIAAIAGHVNIFLFFLSK